MKISFQFLFLLWLLLLTAVACTGDEAERPSLDGPALVMFYTDN